MYTEGSPCRHWHTSGELEALKKLQLNEQTSSNTWRYGSAATYTDMGCLGEIARAHGTAYPFDMLSNKHTNSEEQRSTLLGLFSKVAWKFSLGVNVRLKQAWMNVFYKRFERCNSVVTAWWGRTHKTYHDEMKYIFSLMKRGKEKKRRAFCAVFQLNQFTAEKCIAIHYSVAFMSTWWPWLHVAVTTLHAAQPKPAPPTNLSFSSSEEDGTATPLFI